MSNKVKFGLRNVKYSKITITGGVETYATPVDIPGGVSISLSPVGDPAEFYADDVLYFSQASNQGYEGDLEIALLPKSFLTDILGYIEDTNGAIIENAEQTTSSFALGFEIQGDQKGNRVWMYNCSCVRPNQESNTKEKGTSPVTEKLSIKVAPRLSDKQIKVTMTLSETNTLIYNGFFTSVYEEDQI